MSEWERVLPSPGHLDYHVQRAHEAFQREHCRCRIYDERGKRIPGGAIHESQTGMLVCASHAVLFAQAYARAMAEERDALAAEARDVLAGFDARIFVREPNAVSGPSS